MNSLLETMIVPAAILRIMEMEKLGGPSAEDVRKASETADLLGEHGDILLHGGGKKGQCADLFNRTAHAIAVLAVAPGGVELFGTRFEARRKAGRDGNDGGPGRGRKRRRESGKERQR